MKRSWLDRDRFQEYLQVHREEHLKNHHERLQVYHEEHLQGHHEKYLQVHHEEYSRRMMDKDIETCSRLHTKKTVGCNTITGMNLRGDKTEFETEIGLLEALDDLQVLFQSFCLVSSDPIKLAV